MEKESLSNVFTERKTHKQVNALVKKRFFEETQEKEMSKDEKKFDSSVLEAIDFLDELPELPTTDNSTVSLATERQNEKMKGKRRKLLVSSSDDDEDEEALRQLLAKHEKSIKIYARREQALANIGGDGNVGQALASKGTHFLNSFYITVLQLQEGFSLGMNVVQACRLAGISSSTYNSMLKSYPQLKKQFAGASQDLQIKCIKTLNAGVGIDPDLALKLLERLNPDKYGKNAKKELKEDNTAKSVVNNVLIQIKDKPENILQIMKEALATKPVNSTLK